MRADSRRASAPLLADALDIALVGSIDDARGGGGIGGPRRADGDGPGHVAAHSGGAALRLG